MAVQRISVGGADRRLTATDLRAALDLVQCISDVADPDEFADVATLGLYRLVGCDFASYNELNLTLGRSVLFTEPRAVLRADAEEAFGRNLLQHPIAVYYAENGGGPALRMSDFITLRQFRRTALYDELYVPVDGNYVLAVPLPVPRGIVVGFGLVRTAPDFTDRDRALLDLLRPTSRGRTSARCSARRSVAVDDAAARGECRLLVLDREAKLLYATPSGADALERFFERAYDSRLPGSVQAWLSQGCPGRLTVTRNGARLSIDPVGARPAALLLRETASRPSASTLRSLGLTSREADVLGLLVDGKGNAEIARLLTISPRTVKKHLESVYAKLGVHTRAAAVSVALRST